MGGSPSRMEIMSYYCQQKLGKPLQKAKDLGSAGGRYSLYKTGPVLCVNHNIGASTLSVVLHEIFKLLHHAGVDREDVHVIRLGTSGGVGVAPGTVVISNAACDGLKRKQFHTMVCGKEQAMDMEIDEQTANDILQVAEDLKIPATTGMTMGTDDFYLGQGRLDGYFCDYKLNDKMFFLRELHEFGVRNIEMESHILSAFTKRAGFKCSIVCAALLNRLEGDQVLTPKETLKEWECYPLQIVSEYIKRQVMPEVKIVDTLKENAVEDSGNVSS